MPDIDLFILFRTLLFVFLTIYAVLTLASTIARVWALFAGADSARQVLRLYVSYQLLTIQLKPVRGELAQMAFWAMMLGVLWWLHTLI